jgi:hypothetical protein
MSRLSIRRSATVGAARSRGTPVETDRHRLATPPLRRTITSGQQLLHRIRRFRAVAGLTSVVLLVVGSTRLAGGQAIQPLGLVIGTTAIFLFAVSESYRSIAAYIHTEDRRVTEVANAARRDGASLAVNTLQHHIGNKLAVTVGYGEMLLDDPRLPPDLQVHAQKVLSSAMAAAAVVHKLDKQLTRIEVDRGVTGAEVLDVDASTQVDPQPSHG